MPQRLVSPSRFRQTKRSPTKPSNRGRAMRRTLSGGVIGLLLAGCSVATSLPDPISTADRLETFPSGPMPLERPVNLRWSPQMVPFVEAETDGDAAFTLGLIHAHLRLGQLEVARHVSQGRIAELGGPLATEIDHSLRILGYGRAAPEILAAMEPETRAWLDRFVEGLNWTITHTDPDSLPHEFAVLGLEPTPWTATDVITLGRLGGTDVNWLSWFSLLPHRDSPDWPDILDAAHRVGISAPPSASATLTSDSGETAQRQEAQAMLGGLLGGMSRSGSNSVAVSAARSATGGALIASDPHLGVSVPNIWLLAGVKSPSLHVVGMMPVGVPLFALGRSPDMAWGGTNMRAASSDLVDVSDLDPDQFTTETHRLTVRWWADDTVEGRVSPYGPVISDAPLFPDVPGKTLAVRWTGHGVSDEIGALFKAAKARNPQEFRDAFDDFSVSGQNMVFVDKSGSIGLVSAVHLPRRDPDGALAQGRKIIADLGQDTAAWDSRATARDLPFILNPPSGFIASANNAPGASDVPIGWYFSAPDRIERLGTLLGADDQVSVEDLAALQRDTMAPGSLKLRDALIGIFGATLGQPAGSAGAATAALITAWDGDYSAESQGALAFEAFLSSFAPALYTALGWDTLYEAVGRSGHLKAHIEYALRTADPAQVRALVEDALAVATDAVAEHGQWGTIHRLQLAHPLSNLPLLGSRYVFTDIAAGGSLETVMKTAHSLTADPHSVRYGSQSRHISDMSDPDANWFVLLGGQDGMLRADNFMDQTALWQDGRYIQLPLSDDGIARAFPQTMQLTPR